MVYEISYITYYMSQKDENWTMSNEVQVKVKSDNSDLTVTIPLIKNSKHKK